MGTFAVFDLLPTTLFWLRGVKLLSPHPKLCQKVLKITVTTWAQCAFVVESESFKSLWRGERGSSYGAPCIQSGLIFTRGWFLMFLITFHSEEFGTFGIFVVSVRLNTKTRKERTHSRFYFPVYSSVLCLPALLRLYKAVNQTTVTPLRMW